MKKLLRWLVLALILVGVAAVFGVRVMEAEEEKAAADQPAGPKRLSVEVAPAAEREFVDRVEFTGVIRPRTELDVFAKVPGRVEQVLVEAGDRVVAGQVLAVVERHETELQAAQAAAQVEAATTVLAQARVAVRPARQQLDRVRALRDAGLASEADVEAAESANRAALAAVRTAESQVPVARAAADVVAETLKNADVTSPISGTVVQRLVDPGSQAFPGQPLFRIQDLEELRMEGAVDAASLARLRPNQAVEIASVDVGGAGARGVVTRIAPSLDPATRRADVEVAIRDPDAALLPNALATAVVVVGRSSRLAVPEAAVVSLPAGPAVYVVREGSAVAVQPQLAPAVDGYCPVISGIAAGDEVVVSGQAKLSDGAAVEVAARRTTGGSTR